jgi:hypothetical protein
LSDGVRVPIRADAESYFVALAGGAVSRRRAASRVGRAGNPEMWCVRGVMR